MNICWNCGHSAKPNVARYLAIWWEARLAISAGYFAYPGGDDLDLNRCADLALAAYKAKEAAMAEEEPEEKRLVASYERGRRRGLADASKPEALVPVVAIEKIPGQEVVVKLSDMVLLIRKAGEVLRRGGATITADIYDEVAHELEVIGRDCHYNHWIADVGSFERLREAGQ